MVFGSVEREMIQGWLVWLRVVNDERVVVGRRGGGSNGLSFPAVVVYGIHLVSVGVKIGDALCGSISRPRWLGKFAERFGSLFVSSWLSVGSR